VPPLSQVWAYSSRFYEPDWLFEECVVKFPKAKLAQIFCAPADGQVKSISTREVTADENGRPRSYSMRDKIFSPTDMGIPSTRHRQYTSFCLRPFFEFVDSISFEDLFFRGRSLDSSVYLDAIGEPLRKAELLDAMRSGSAGTDGLPLSAEEPGPWAQGQHLAGEGQ
jgi:hypothetical protein